MRHISLIAACCLLSSQVSAEIHPSTLPSPSASKATATRSAPTAPPSNRPKKSVVKTHAAAQSLPALPEPEEIDADRLAVAPSVFVGPSQCEHGKKVDLKPHPSLAGRFLLSHGKDEHILTPQPTNTGVIRLENQRAGIVWLQVPIKSMLMDAKKGQRLADSCLHPEQVAEVEALRAPKTP
jgi:hypothetical protein